MRPTQAGFILVLVLLCSLPARGQSIWHVDDDVPFPGTPSGSLADPFPTIQQALAVAAPGDTVRVAAGDYDVGLLGSIVLTDVRLEAAPLDPQGNPVCEITGTSAQGAILIMRGTAVAEGFEIHSSTAAGGVDMTGSSQLRDCQVFGNTAYFNTAGVHAVGSCLIERCHISGCTGSNALSNATNGGLTCIGGTVRDSTVCYCEGAADLFIAGGVAGVSLTNATMINCLVEGNSVGTAVAHAAAGVQLNNAHIENCVIRGNLGGDGDAGGVGGVAGTGTVVNCTIVDNVGGDGGLGSGFVTAQGGVGGVSGATFINCIIARNVAGNLGAAADIGMAFGEGVPTAGHCLIPGGYPGTGNLDAMPTFRIAHPAPFSADFLPAPGSPGINGGDPGAPTQMTDYAGRPRDLFRGVDMGAHEYDLGFAADSTAGAFDLLEINGGTGGPFREVRITAGSSWSIGLAEIFGDPNLLFYLYGRIGLPTANDLTTALPWGELAIAPPPFDPGAPERFVLVDQLTGGPAILPGGPTPWEAVIPPLVAPLDLVFQGIVLTPLSPLNYANCNAVAVTIR